MLTLPYMRTLASRATSRIRFATVAPSTPSATAMASREGASAAQPAPTIDGAASEPQTESAEKLQQQEAQEQPEGGAPPTGCNASQSSLEQVDPNELLRKRNKILWDQAQRGEQPGLTLMKDALSGENKAQAWGNEPTIMEPEQQN